VGSVDVVVDAVILDDHLCFKQAVELPQVQQLEALALVSGDSKLGSYEVEFLDARQ
jgi:hypothetical protein